MKHFQPSEFRAFDKMAPEFLAFLDDVRDTAGVPFRLTSDWRSPVGNAAASGSSPTSLHLLGRAVDFTVPWTREALWSVTMAVMLRAHGHSVELELVSGPTDHHIHLGLFPDNRPSRLILTLD